jgi:hypothetical protein
VAEHVSWWSQRPRTSISLHRALSRTADRFHESASKRVARFARRYHSHPHHRHPDATKPNVSLKMRPRFETCG